jgi:prophage antirepressor-like protein
MLDSQAWFCLQDTARLMGRPLDERATLKLDPDQRRTAWLSANGQWSKQLLISESGLFAMLVHHYGRVACANFQLDEVGRGHGGSAGMAV